MTKKGAQDDRKDPFCARMPTDSSALSSVGAWFCMCSFVMRGLGGGLARNKDHGLFSGRGWPPSVKRGPPTPPDPAAPKRARLRGLAAAEAGAVDRCNSIAACNMSPHVCAPAASCRCIVVCTISAHVCVCLVGSVLGVRVKDLSLRCCSGLSVFMSSRRKNAVIS